MLLITLCPSTTGYLPQFRKISEALQVALTPTLKHSFCPYPHWLYVAQSILATYTLLLSSTAILCYLAVIRCYLSTSL